MKSTKKILGILSLAALAGMVFASGKFELPKYETVKLKNGLTLYLLEHHEVPLIQMNAVFPAGAVWDGKQAGLASLTAEALALGTRAYPKTQLEEALDFIGANWSCNADLESATVSINFAKKDLDQVLPIFKELLLEPTFDEGEFAKHKQRTITQLTIAKESPRNVIGEYYRKMMYGNGPYGNPVNGQEDSLDPISAEACRQFWKQRYQPQSAALVVAGDFDSAGMKQKLETHFASWQGDGKNLEYLPKKAGDSSATKKARVLLVNKDDAIQTEFRIGGFGIPRNNPDYTELLVINTILGGRFTSWLNDELRVNAGLTYGAHSQFSTYIDSGLFTISTFTRTDTTEQAIDLALEVYHRLFNKGVDEVTLESAKNYVIGAFAPKYETADQLADLLVQMHVYGFDDRFIQDFTAKVRDLNVDRTKSLISKYFPKNHLQFVLIGKAETIREIAKKYGELQEKQILDAGF